MKLNFQSVKNFLKNEINPEIEGLGINVQNLKSTATTLYNYRHLCSLFFPWGKGEATTHAASFERVILAIN